MARPIVTLSYCITIQERPGFIGRGLAESKLVYPHSTVTDATLAGGPLSTIQLPFGIKTDSPQVYNLVEELKSVKKRSDGIDGLDLRKINFTPLVELRNPKTRNRVNLDRLLLILLADKTDTEYPLVGADLTDADLTGANLIGANLTRANLIGANLTKADLTGANLIGANLIKANLIKANLTKADLTGANLFGASLDRARLDRARLDGARLRGAYVYNQAGQQLIGKELKSYLSREFSGIKNLDSAVFE